MIIDEKTDALLWKIAGEQRYTNFSRIVQSIRYLLHTPSKLLNGLNSNSLLSRREVKNTGYLRRAPRALYWKLSTKCRFRTRRDTRVIKLNLKNQDFLASVCLKQLITSFNPSSVILSPSLRSIPSLRPTQVPSQGIRISPILTGNRPQRILLAPPCSIEHVV